MPPKRKQAAQNVMTGKKVKTNADAVMASFLELSDIQKGKLCARSEVRIARIPMHLLCTKHVYSVPRCSVGGFEENA